MYGLGLLEGMRVTWRNLLRPAVTIQYPDERAVLPARSRLALRHKLDANGAVKCTACMACERACPDGIIRLEVETREDRSKRIVSCDWEVGACMFCGLCVESCPFDAIEMGDEYELAVRDRALLDRRLLADVDAASTRRAAAGEEGGDA